MILETIRSPEDIRAYDQNQIKTLCEEIRREILETVSKNGGHLASNLGMVEATVALHRVFHSPSDQFVFDVGHQCYAHKLLTGRYGAFSSLRTYGGISGFTNPAESEHDAFYEGHCGTSLSSALGIAAANAMQGKEDYVVAIVGDGAFTNGMIYEALNNCTQKRDLHLIFLLNDNEMSISKNVGGFPKHLDTMRTSRNYYSFKHKVSRLLSHVPFLFRMGRKTKAFMKRQVLKYNLFESLGVDYIGPVDGNDVEKMEVVLEEAKKRRNVCVIHMVTKKGKGYALAEQNPSLYHGVGAFSLDEGYKENKESFSEQFGKALEKEARNNSSVCAITAAMCDGTGLGGFAEEFPNRFFDVGIAEEHAVTFAGGLAKQGFLPVFAVYSTFSQRIYDQVWHDIALQNLPLVLCLDRAGFVPGDGITHQGIFDVPLFSAVPHAELYAPENYAELRACLSRAIERRGFTVVRYPKGAEDPCKGLVEQGDYCATPEIEGAENVLVTYGRVTKRALAACRQAGFGLIKLVKIYPVPDLPLNNAKHCYLLEEGYQEGGIMQKLAVRLEGEGKRCLIHAVQDFLCHGSLDDLYALAGMDEKSLSEQLKAFAGQS